jgi:hypothetical protein
MGMTSDKAMITFFAGLGIMILLIVWMVLDAANLSNCLSVGMQWVDHDCVVIKGETE